MNAAKNISSRLVAKKQPLLFTPIGLLMLSACGGGGSSSSGSSSGGSTSVGGHIVKGPLSNALVFLDYNSNGVLDAGEPSARTTADGSYRLLSSNPNFSIVAITDGSTIDTASGGVLDGITLKASSGASVVTPATTLMVEGNLTAAQVAQVLGLPDNVDPTSFNPFAAGVDATDALAAEKVSQQIMSVITAFAGALEGAGASESDAYTAALRSIASTVQAKAAANETLDLTSPSDIALIQTALTDEVSNSSDLSAVNKTALDKLIGDTASAIKNVNEEIAAITDTDLTSTASKNIFSTVQVLKDQVEVAAAAEVTAPGSGNIAFTDANAVDAAAANNAPSDLVLDNNVISEAAESFVVGVVATTDGDQPTGVAFKYSIAEVAGTDHDKFTINSSTGELSLIEQPDFETSAAYTVVIKSVDASGKALSRTFNVFVLDANEAPSVTSTAVTSISEDTAYIYTFAANDVDAGDTVTLTATILPSWLSFAPETGLLSGTPSNNDVGNHAVVLKAADAAGTVTTQSFSITVLNINDAPTIISSPVTLANEGAAYTYIFNASDVDVGDTITLAAPELPAWLTFNQTTGVLAGTPTNSHVGNHVVILTATDVAGAVETHSFTLRVFPKGNNPPSVTSTPITSTNEDTAYHYVLKASDVDKADIVTLSAEMLPAWLHFESATGILSGTPSNSDVGNHAVILATTDVEGAVEKQPFIISVNNTNDAPTITSSPNVQAVEHKLYSYTFVGSDVDEGDTITLAANKIPSWLIFDTTTGVLSGTPATSDVGVHDIVLTVTDASYAIDAQSFSITVIKRPPMQSSTRLQGKEGPLDDLHPEVTTLSDSSFVLVWHAETSDRGEYDIFLKRFSSHDSVQATEASGIFQIATNGPMDQLPKVVPLDDDEFVLVWHGGSIYNQEWGIFVQKFKGNEAIGDISQLHGVMKDRNGNTIIKMLEDKDPQVSALPNGGFVIAWTGVASDGQGKDIYVQNFDKNGDTYGETKRLSSMSGDLEDVDPQVRTLTNGDYVVAWVGSTSDSNGSDIYIQKFLQDGVVSGEMKRLSGMTGNLLDTQVQVGILPNESFVVVWVGNTSDGEGWDVFVQKFNSSVEEISNKVRLQGMYGDLRDYSPQVIGFQDGGFVVTWQSWTSDGQGFDIFFQRFNNQGLRDGDTFRLKGMEGNFGDWHPQVAALTDNGFVIAWSGETSDNQNNDVFLQIFNGDEDDYSREIEDIISNKGGANYFPIRLQGQAGDLSDWAPKLASFSDGNFLVTWHGSTADRQGTDIFVEFFDRDGNLFDVSGGNRVDDILVVGSII